MAMPKAAMDEDGQLAWPKGEVGRSRQFADIDAISEACRVNGAPYYHLGAGVAIPHTAHECATLGSGKAITH
jgi:mannitol/fructose-specific phosphotransferase system IIA component (Ntr-type)